MLGFLRGREIVRGTARLDTGMACPEDPERMLTVRTRVSRGREGKRSTMGGRGTEFVKASSATS